MELTKRQEKIVEIIKKYEPITGKDIAEKLNLSRSALRTDFSVLNKLGLIKAKQRVGYVFVQEKKKYVKDIMSLPVFVNEKTSVYDTLLKMFSADVGSIFIAEGNSLTGVVSRKDLLKISIGKSDITMVPISLIMTRMPNIIYTTPDEEIIVAVKKIIDHEIDSLPVVEIIENESKANYKLVGRITKTNVTKLFLEYFL